MVQSLPRIFSETSTGQRVCCNSRVHLQHPRAHRRPLQVSLKDPKTKRFMDYTGSDFGCFCSEYCDSSGDGDCARCGDSRFTITRRHVYLHGHHRRPRPLHLRRASVWLRILDSHCCSARVRELAFHSGHTCTSVLPNQAQRTALNYITEKFLTKIPQIRSQVRTRTHAHYPYPHMSLACRPRRSASSLWTRATTTGVRIS